MSTQGAALRGGTQGAAALALAALILGSAAQADTTEPEGAAEAVLAKTLAALTKRTTEVQTIRRLRAGTLDGKHSAWMEAAVSVDTGGGLSYRILGEGGSKRTREKVLQAVLDGEQDACDNWQLSALTAENYTFSPEPSTTGDFRRFRMTPRRQDPRLVSGVLTVTPDGQPVLVEGRLAKSPSFWVRSVTVIRRFGSIDGVTLPVSVESLADVRMVGSSAFSMEYEYTAVNGRPVADVTRVAAGPSSQLLALHAALKGDDD
jgi:hypothetical protein